MEPATKGRGAAGAKPAVPGAPGSEIANGGGLRHHGGGAWSGVAGQGDGSCHCLGRAGAAKAPKVSGWGGCGEDSGGSIAEMRGMLRAAVEHIGGCDGEAADPWARQCAATVCVSAGE